MTHEIPPDLIRAAERAGMHDPDDLRMLSRAQIDGDPTTVIANLREQRPHLFRFTKQAKDMSPAERAAAIADAKANPRPAPARTAPITQHRAAEPATPPADKPKSAVTMLLEERAAYLREHAKKYPTEMANFRYPRKSPYEA